MTQGYVFDNTQCRSCDDFCSGRGMTTQMQDWTNYIKQQLEKVICKRGVKINAGGQIIVSPYLAPADESPKT